jgi:hypothetical protein
MRKEKKKVWPGARPSWVFLAVEKTPLGHAHAVLSFMQPSIFKNLRHKLIHFPQQQHPTPPPSPKQKQKRKRKKQTG